MRMSQHVIALAACSPLEAAQRHRSRSSAPSGKRNPHVSQSRWHDATSDALWLPWRLGVVSIAIAWASFPAPLTSRLTSLDVSRIDTLLSASLQSCKSKASQ
jgi:hypothetical protein